MIPWCRAGRGRAFVLIAAMAVVGGALLISTGLIFTTSVEVASSMAHTRRVQSRALAWSGLQAVMSKLQDQRQQVLDGQAPRLDEQYTVYESPHGLGVVRLLPIGLDGRRLVAEGGRVPLNSATIEELEQTGMIDADLARAIVEFRDQQLAHRYQAVDELLLVPGMTAAKLHGMEGSGAVPGGTSTRRAADRDSERLREAAAPVTQRRGPGVGDVLTVHDWEPAVQRDGSPRINLNVPWSDDLARRIDQRFGRGEAVLVEQVFKSGVQFDRESRLIEVMLQHQVEPKDWAPILDAFTTEPPPGALHFGRVDLNSAPEEALLTLPGIARDQAARIVAARESLSPEDRGSIAWPILKGIIEPSSYVDLAGRVTTRCFAWRVRLQSGEVLSDDPSGELMHPLTYEAVIDLSGSRPRLAYLSDLTLQDAMVQLAAAEPAEADRPLGEAASPEDDAGPDALRSAKPALPGFWLASPWSASAGAPSPAAAARASSEPAAGAEPSTGGSDAPPGVGPRTGIRLGRWKSGA